MVEVGVKEQKGAAEEAKPGAAGTAAPKEIDVARIKALDMKVKVSDSIMDVFETMFSTDIAPVDTVELSVLKGVRNVGSVSFTGDVDGQINIHMTEEFSRKLTAEMLGMEEDELESNDDIKDMVGELSNILGGNLKSEFTDAGLSCQLSTPAFTTGKDFMIESFNMKRYDRFAFGHQNDTVFVELGIKFSDDLQIGPPPEGETIHFSVNDASEESAEQPEQQAEPEPQPAETEQPAEIATPPQEEMQAVEDFDLNLLLDIPLEITVELGRSQVQIQELLTLGPGSTLTLAKLEGEPVDILANDKLIARGEVVLQNKKYGIRITEITSRMNRIKSLS